MEDSATAETDNVQLEVLGERIIVVTESTAPQSGYILTSLAPSSSEISQSHTSHLKSPALKPYLLSHLPPYLSLPPEDIHVIISTKSGTEQAATTFENVLKPVLVTVGAVEGSYQELWTESSDTVRDFATGPLKKRAQAGVKQTVLLLSGDGGIADIVNGLMQDDGTTSSIFTRPTIIVFPLGTGNALFHSLHRPVLISAKTPPSDLITALHTLLFGHQASLPLFRARFSPKSRLITKNSTTASCLPASNTLYGGIVASYGLHSTLVADSDTPEWRKHGSARFGMVARKLLAQPHAYKAKLTLRTESQERVVPRTEHGYILLTLHSSLEKTFTISPASQPLSHTMHVIHFAPLPGAEVGRIMGLAYAGGQHVADQAVSYEEVTGLRVDFLETDAESGSGSGGEDAMESGRWRRVCIDGLIVRVDEGGWMDVSLVPPGEKRGIDAVISREIRVEELSID